MIFSNNIPKFPEISRNFQKFPEFSRNFHGLEISINFQKFQLFWKNGIWGEGVWNVKNELCQHCTLAQHVPVQMSRCSQAFSSFGSMHQVQHLWAQLRQLQQLCLTFFSVRHLHFLLLTARFISCHSYWVEHHARANIHPRSVGMNHTIEHDGLNLTCLL